MTEHDRKDDRKNIKISFRTDEATCSKLKLISRYVNTTTSSLIESLLIDHVLRNDTPLPPPGDKRRYPRKKCSLPALLQIQNGEQVSYNNGTIINISLESMQAIVHEPSLDPKIDATMTALFSIPGKQHPFLLHCICKRIDYINSECLIIAQFACATKTDTSSLMKFLNSSDAVPERKHHSS